MRHNILTTLRFLIVIAAATLGLPPVIHAASSQPYQSPAVTARLISAQDGVPDKGRTLSAALDLQLGDGWKTYWRSPGEVGIPPTLDWAGSENVADAEFLWPAPERFSAFGIENFGYHDEVVFPLRIELARPGEAARLQAKVSLLVCSDICVPQDFDLSLELPAGSGIDQPAADRIAGFLALVPAEGDGIGVEQALVHLDDKTRALTVLLRSAKPFKDPDVFPELGAGNALGKPDIRLGDGGHRLWATLPVLSTNDTTRHDAILTVTDGPDRSFTVTPDRASEAPAPPFNVAAVAPGIETLIWIALVAFLGGLILNVMPCVLPVLSIKLSTVMKHGEQDKRTVRIGFLAAAAGALAFMWGLALILFLLQQAGVVVGWGLQFQNPLFLAAMVLLLSVFSANMLGGFEFSLPSALQARLANSGRGRGHVTDFLTGMFAAVMATPCSAPFLGTAIAFALAGRGIDIFIVFTSLGIGLAVPYLLVAAVPGAISLLPKPGRWMVALRFLLGGLLMATVAWLLWVMVGVAGTAAAAAVGGLALALAVALSVPRLPSFARWPIVVAFAGLALVAVPQMTETEATEVAASSLDWAPFDRAEIARRVSRGEVVFVDVTADWCLTCKANKAMVIERDPVLTALRAEGTVPMQADWTRPDETISRYLERFGRYGIPFNAVYGPGAPDGIVLSEILSGEAVINALRSASGDRVTTSGLFDQDW
ncbi:protein-disulfide reductase DsbD family protein [Psychromarinibacter sp. C21-152]|uniref:Protein-disulfide reductase DsbD family protein n=1 Tax=Psychromarinibacter sediminicola TaxID=3033385 RepID=A0AAE3NTT0_9RHOB|nr:protein-disulfide reductase DsbD domain-containing protein [Psychromarinibacter sediminicola]MDF0603403.1 protein-disulfide reductase DsbD family protein [Psychromarinibacter sediminicola]